MIRLGSFLIPIFLLCSCAQWWQVRPYPDFIVAEIKAGDQLRIETSDGLRSKLVVVSVLNDRIVGEDQVVLFNDITSLEKRSKTSPANACNPSQSLGCSVPEWATWLHDSQSKYRDYFYPSCEQHDYCYRHGAATYGMDRGTCDENFLRSMQNQCSPSNFGTFIKEINLDLAECTLIAMEFYQIVRKYGARHFNSSNSSYCEYDGPP
jgi:hypothetical protein